MADQGSNVDLGEPAVQLEEPLERIESSVLRATIRPVVDTLLARCNGAITRPRAVESVTRVARAVEDLSTLDLGSTDASGLALLQRVLELLSNEVIRNWLAQPTPPDAAEMHGLLNAFEAVRDQLHSHPQAVLASLVQAPQGSDLISELAHDLRSPLTSILFLSETLRRGQSGEINELQHRQLGIIYSAAIGMVNMASDVIELARGGDQLTERKPVAFSVREILDSIHDLVRPIAEEKGLRIRLFPPRIDQRLGYPVALSRVLLNLITNALKFTPEGFVEVMAVEQQRTRIEFSVRDTGNGISPEAEATLFEPFHYSPSTNRYGFSGTGLGLTICRRLVAAMGSELRYETSPGWGTRFFFQLNLPPAQMF